MREDSRCALEELRQIALLTTALAGEVAAGVEAPSHELLELRGNLLALYQKSVGARRDYVEKQVRRALERHANAALKLHLGAADYALDGWIGIDHAPAEVALDLRWGLPFADGSIALIYASHVLEHFTSGDANALLSDAYRVLQPGGVFRIVVPDLEQCLRAYADGDDEFFAERAATWPWASRCRTRLQHFLGYAGADQRIETFFSHKLGFDWETLALMLRDAGFDKVRRCDFMQSPLADLRIDTASHAAGARHAKGWYSLFVEATK